MSKLTREERIELIAKVQEMRNLAEELMEVLMPEGEAGDVCTHPDRYIEDDSTMGEPLYRCTRCGKEQDTPFVHQQ